MIYRRFGKTELSMPVLSLGCMRSMYRWQDLPLSKIPQNNQTTLRDIVQKALALGINHFETARGYGSSERQLGEILAELPRDKIILQTKVAPQKDPDEFSRQFLESLHRLQTDHVELLTIHGINDHKSLWYTCKENGCLTAARALQTQGKAGHIGFSGHGATDLITEAISHNSDQGFDYVNLHWYFINQGNLPAIKAAEEQDMGVFIISPTDKGGMLHLPSEKMTKLCKPLSPILFNDLFCLSHPQVKTISIGAARLSDFDEHLKVLPLLKEDHTEQVQLIYQNLTRAMQDATNHGDPAWLSARLPSWENSPGYINMPMILWLYNLAKGWDMQEFAKRRYRQLGQDMPWVPGNNAATIDHFDLSEILAAAPMPTDKIITMLQEAHTDLKYL